MSIGSWIAYRQYRWPTAVSLANGCIGNPILPMSSIYRQTDTTDEYPMSAVKCDLKGHRQYRPAHRQFRQPSAVSPDTADDIFLNTNSLYCRYTLPYTYTHTSNFLNFHWSSENSTYLTQFLTKSCSVCFYRFRTTRSITYVKINWFDPLNRSNSECVSF